MTMSKFSEKPLACAASIVAIVATLVAAFIVHGISADVYYHTNLLKLQTVADLAVLAGANYLPTNPRTAAQVSAAYATYNGVASNEIVLIEIGSDKQSLRIHLNRKIPIYIGLFAGLPRSDIAVMAAAHSGSNRPEAPLRYVMGAL